MRNTVYLRAALIILFWALSLVNAGCYTPLTLNHPRTGVGIGADKIDNKIYFAGGLSDSTRRPTDEVEVLDLTADTWTSFQLPAPGVYIDVFVYESMVIFAGGLDSNRIDIYHKSNGTFTTIQMNFVANALRSHVIGSTAYFYQIRQTRTIIVLDLITLSVEYRYLQLGLSTGRTSLRTNGTHWFAIQRESSQTSLYVFDDTGALSTRLTLQLWVQELFIVNDKLVLVGTNQIAEISLSHLSVRVLPPLLMNMEGALLVGLDIYVIAQDQLTVISPSGIIQYSIGQVRFTEVTSAVEFNGRIYFSFRSSAIESIVTININALFQQYQLSTLRSHVVNGFHFEVLGNVLQYLKLSTGQLFTYVLESQSVHTAVSGNKLVTIDDRLFHMFNTETESWTNGTIQFVQRPGISVVVRDLIVFDATSYCYLFNTTTLAWTVLQVPAVSPFPVHNSLVFIERDPNARVISSLRIFDISSRQWRTLAFPVAIDQSPQFDYTTLAYKDLLVIAGGFNNRKLPREYHDDVFIVNITDGSFKHEHLSSPRARIKALTVGHFMIFAGGTTHSLTPIIDIYNVITAEWRTVALINRFTNSFNIIPFRDSLFIARPNGVELVNITLGTIQLTPIPYTEPRQTSSPGEAVGSKVIIFGRTANGISISVYETTTSATGVYRIDGPYDAFITQNFISAGRGSSLHVLQFATMENLLHSDQRFFGDSKTFDVNLRGVDLTSQWYRYGVKLIGETQPALTMNNITQQSEGDYSIQITDQCNQLMTQTARLTVHGPPVIIDQLTDSIVMCHEMTTISTQVRGVQMTMHWTIGDLNQSTTSQSINVSGSSFTCNTSHRLCLSAINPSGTTTQCTTVRVVDHDAIFAGPRQLSSLTHLIRKTDVDLIVSLLDEDCTEHEWLVNGVKSGVRGERTSTMTVNLNQSMVPSSFSVVARCGNSVLTSHEFKFNNVSHLDVGGVVAVVLVCFAALIASLVIAYIVRVRVMKSRQAEVEMESLLNQAKAETLSRDGVPILKSTSWEWSPSEYHTFKPVDKMSFALDSTALTSMTKREPIKVGVWNTNTISFSPRKGSGKQKQTKLKERLIYGTHVDIYAPKSPKYEIKIEPSSFDIDSDMPVQVTVSSIMRITSKCKVGLIVVCEQEQVYSIVEFKLTSAMSTWIDLDEVEMTGDYLGGGGFGSVTLGVYRGQQVAVKRLLSQYLTPEMHIEFEREITLMKDLHHPNIVQFVGASNIKDNLAIVIEFAPLGSLASVIEKHSLTLNMKITMLLESAKALQFLHANDIIHRDIKPQNILVFSLEPKSQVHVKLTDFGTARLISEEAMTVTKNIGTISFMAPESLGKSPRIEKSADVYSFALLMWSVLLEQTPFSEFKWDSDVEAHVKQGNRLPFPTDNDNNNGDCHINPALISLISECWAHEPHKRPSISSVVQRLTNISSSK